MKRFGQRRGKKNAGWGNGVRRGKLLTEALKRVVQGFAQRKEQRAFGHRFKRPSPENKKQNARGGIL